jgi:EmrB/QacA subfamily drug resistance transporter
MSASRGSEKIVLTAMIFAVAMTFIDQTIVSIAAPKIQSQLGLTDTGLQWAVNSYLLALAAFFAFGGRLADIVGHRKMVVIGVIVFALASAMCGLTPTNGLAEAWIVTFRAVQGIGGALMYPAALAIVVDAYPKEQRGRALALFFGIAGGLTAVGPALGGFLTEWTWRAIFWVNIPVALIALLLIARSKPTTDSRPARMDIRGAVTIAAGVALSVFGFQQSATWGWSNPATEIAIALGVVWIAIFIRIERHVDSPLIDLTIFRDRTFFVENAVLLVAMMAFVPVFFFASEYAQISLGEKASKASLVLLYFFAGFVVAAQIGGRMLDRIGAKRPVVVGCILACVGLVLWANRVTTLSLGPQIWCIVLTGAGMGMMLGQANTDALNRAPSTSYGEATGITQTVRNYAASLGLAILGTIQVTVLKSHVASSLIAQGLPSTKAHHEASSIAQLSGGSGSANAIPSFLQHDFASATQEVLYTMAVIMGVAAVVAFVGLQRPTRRAALEPEPATA